MVKAYGELKAGDVFYFRNIGYVKTITSKFIIYNPLEQQPMLFTSEILVEYLGNVKDAFIFPEPSEFPQHRVERIELRYCDNQMMQ